MRRLHSRVSGPTSLTCTTGVCPPSITCWDPSRSDHGSSRSWRREPSIASASASRCTADRRTGDSKRSSLFGGTGIIATGSTRHALAARAMVMISGFSSARTRTDGHSLSTSRRCRTRWRRDQEDGRKPPLLGSLTETYPFLRRPNNRLYWAEGLFSLLAQPRILNGNIF